MRVMFLACEQYVPYEYEAANLEVRLPILDCGLVTDHRDLVHHRVYRARGAAFMNEAALRAAADFHPDIVVYFSSTERPEDLRPETLEGIRALGCRLLSIRFDSRNRLTAEELSVLVASSHLAVLTSPSDYVRYRMLAEAMGRPGTVACLIGYNADTGLFRPSGAEKAYDVSFVGSNHGARVAFLRELGEHLRAGGIDLHRVGGNLDDEIGITTIGATAPWISYAEYVDTINRSRICLNAQTWASDQPGGFGAQIKGKYFEYLAAGAFCLTDRNPEVAVIVPDEHLATYEDLPDCVEKICWWLAHDAERAAFAAAAHEWFHRTFDRREFWRRMLTAIMEDAPLPVPPRIEEHYRRVASGELSMAMPL